MIQSDNFTPFFGRVEDFQDEKENGRYRVRIYGYNADKSILPTDMLRWFSTVNSNTQSLGGIGHSPTGYNVGSLVFGFYIDEDRQQGIILGSIPGFDGDVNDVNHLARGEAGEHIQALKDSAKKDVSGAGETSWSEPQTAYAAKYPFNSVNVTRSGHIIEVDDTEGAERIKIFHKSGTMTEIHPDGTTVRRSVKDDYEVITGNKFVSVEGDVNTVIDGNLYKAVQGDATYDTEGTHIIRAPNIQLGEDDAVEPSVLGNKLASWITSELVPWLNSHNHIGNLGKPTSPASTGPKGPFDPGTGKKDGAVYSKVNTNQ
jgi:hypothetical protein